MIAGLPGMGLSGLFALLSALVLPVRKALSRRRLFRSPHRPMVVLAGVIALASVSSWAVIGGAASSGGASGRVLGVPVLAVTIGVMALVLAVPAVIDLVGRAKGPDFN